MFLLLGVVLLLCADVFVMIVSCVVLLFGFVLFIVCDCVLPVYCDALWCDALWCAVMCLCYDSCFN